MGIKHLSLYAFQQKLEEASGGSARLDENFSPIYIMRELDKLHENNVKVQIMGDIGKLPNYAKDEVIKPWRTTSQNTGMILNIGLNYGWKR